MQEKAREQILNHIDKTRANSRIKNMKSRGVVKRVLHKVRKSLNGGIRTGLVTPMPGSPLGFK